ncbi:MAG: hypothetical protein AAFV26_09060 [Pseudomonadota bacterium]
MDLPKRPRRISSISEAPQVSAIQANAVVPHEQHETSIAGVSFNRIGKRGLVDRISAFPQPAAASMSVQAAQRAT